MKHESYKCDTCGKEKQAVNHWYLVLSFDEFASMLDKHLVLRFSTKWLQGALVLQWDDELANHSNVRHVCGQDHAVGLLSRWMHYQSFDIPATATADKGAA